MNSLDVALNDISIHFDLLEAVPYAVHANPRRALWKCTTSYMYFFELVAVCCETAAKNLSGLLAASNAYCPHVTDIPLTVAHVKSASCIIQGKKRCSPLIMTPLRLQQWIFSGSGHEAGYSKLSSDPLDCLSVGKVLARRGKPRVSYS